MPEQLTADQIEAKQFSTADLLRLANEEMAAQAAQQNGQPVIKTEEKPEQPRNTDGTFAKKEEAAPAEEDEQQKADEEADEQEKEVVVYKDFDIGDGAGVQRYTGRGPTKEAALEDLSEKLLEGKKNANKKIRDLEQKIKAQEAPNKDEEFVLSQELMANPTLAFRKMIKSEFGMSVEQLRESLNGAQQLTENQKKQIVVQNFLTTHPDYDDSIKNGKLMQKWMGNEFTAESFEKAYQDLKSDGLLELKTEGAHDGQEQTKRSESPTEKTTVEEVPPQRIARKSSGISTKARPAAAPKEKTPEEIEAELYSMPMDKLRELGMKQ